jgi:hypothetical protein
MSSPHSGPWVPNGSPQAQGFELLKQQRETEAAAPFRLRQAIRRQMEASGEIEALIQAKIDERIKENEIAG